MVINPDGLVESTDGLETPMIIGKPAPFVRAFVEAVDEAIRAHQPSHGMSAMQRTWLAFCVTAVLVTNSICWARFERASLGTYSLAALSWMFRHSKIGSTEQRYVKFHRDPGCCPIRSQRSYPGWRLEG